MKEEKTFIANLRRETPKSVNADICHKMRNCWLEENKLYTVLAAVSLIPAGHKSILLLHPTKFAPPSSSHTFPPACSRAIALASIKSLPGLFKLANVTGNYKGRGKIQSSQTGLSAGIASWSSSPKSSTCVRAGVCCGSELREREGKGNENTALLLAPLAPAATTKSRGRVIS